MKDLTEIRLVTINASSAINAYVSDDMLKELEELKGLLSISIYSKSIFWDDEGNDDSLVKSWIKENLISCKVQVAS